MIAYGVFALGHMIYWFASDAARLAGKTEANGH